MARRIEKRIAALEQQADANVDRRYDPWLETMAQSYASKEERAEALSAFSELESARFWERMAPDMNLDGLSPESDEYQERRYDQWLWVMGQSYESHAKQAEALSAFSQAESVHFCERLRKGVTP